MSRLVPREQATHLGRGRAPRSAKDRGALRAGGGCQAATSDRSTYCNVQLPAVV